jgi:hypothetical protein
MGLRGVPLRKEHVHHPRLHAAGEEEAGAGGEVRSYRRVLSPSGILRGQLSLCVCLSLDCEAGLEEACGELENRGYAPARKRTVIAEY